jgi:CRP-like cAMP-binding protein
MAMKRNSLDPDDVVDSSGSDAEEIELMEDWRLGLLELRCAYPRPRPAAYSPKQNHLLAALPAEDYERLLPEMELVRLPLGRVIHSPGAKSDYVYFPTNSLISVLCMAENGSSAEIAATAREGLVGTAFFPGGETMPFWAVVKSSGYAYRLKAAVLNREFEHSGAWQNLALRHTLALIAQMGQSAVCSRLHSTEQQLCRSILWHLDKVQSNELTITHQSIADNLGVRRECVTQTAGRLQKSGLIDCQRGHITVLDRSRLESRACECYSVVKREYSRLLPPGPWGQSGLATNQTSPKRPCAAYVRQRTDPETAHR